MRIDPRLLHVPEDQIYRKLKPLTAKWRIQRIDPPPGYYPGRPDPQRPRHYLFGATHTGTYAYPYSLPVEVIHRLATMLNDGPEVVYMFDWQAWVKRFIAEPGYNDAAPYGVTVSRVAGAEFDVIGVHHLTPDENRGLHHIYIDVLDTNNERIQGGTIKWTWQERTEPGQPDPIRIDKPPNEIANLQFFGGVTVNIWHPLGEGVVGLSANHDDELGPNGEKWNTVGHHSFLVVFRRRGAAPPPPPPPPPPPTGKAVSLVGAIQVTVNQGAISAMTPDADGNVTVTVTIEGI